MRSKRRWKRLAAFVMAVILLNTSMFSCLPAGMLESWGFSLQFVSSGVAGHPYLQGRPEGESETSWFLCLNEGASAKSSYDYSKVDMDVSYSEGTLEQKRLFWAYIGAFGSYDGNAAINGLFYGQVSKEDAKQVAWKRKVPANVEQMANDGFMALDQIPAGCREPKDIFQMVGSYGEPENAMSINALISQPGVIDAGKLYQMCGLDSWDTFRKYCTVTPIDAPEGMIVTCETTDSGIHYSVKSPDGAYVAGQNSDLVMKVEYDPAVFRIINVTGTIEYFQCSVDGSQQLVRVKGDASTEYPAFYLTTGKGSAYVPQTPGGSGGGNGDGLGSDSGVSVTIYQHKETFESNYKVELKKYDYETGYPLKDSVWQVLEKFADQDQLRQDETDGNLVGKNMRNEPVTWEEWLVFEDNMVTDENGWISHQDTRYYDFSHYY